MDNWIILTLLVAFFYGQVSYIYSYGQFVRVLIALGLGLPATLITGILGPYFLINDPKAKSIIIGIVLWFVLLGIYWLVTSGLLVSGPLIQNVS